MFSVGVVAVTRIIMCSSCTPLCSHSLHSIYEAHTVHLYHTPAIVYSFVLYPPTRPRPAPPHSVHTACEVAFSTESSLLCNRRIVFLINTLKFITVGASSTLDLGVVRLLSQLCVLGERAARICSNCPYLKYHTIFFRTMSDFASVIDVFGATMLVCYHRSS